MDAFLTQYWRCVTARDENGLRGYFHPGARILWHNTNEQFTTAEFIRANCEYPGQWQAELTRAEQAGSTVVSVARVWSDALSFHVVSFFEIENGQIKQLDEYWGDDGPPPAWRQDKKIGKGLSQ